MIKPHWWTKTLHHSDGAVILTHAMMTCSLCWAACLDGAQHQTEPHRRADRLLEAEEWREAYRVLNDLLVPRAKRA